MEHSISDQEIKRAYEQAAKFVALYGSKYLPIFERMEQEYKNRKKEKASLTRAEHIYKSSIS